MVGKLHLRLMRLPTLGDEEGGALGDAAASDCVSSSCVWIVGLVMLERPVASV